MPSLDTPVSLATFALLMLAFQVKHFAGDFLLQNTWMAHGKNATRGWAKPLAVHAGLHGLGTLAIALAVEPVLWWLGLLDFAVHGLIDRGKALAGRRWHYGETDPRFWWLVGFDQLLHGITNIGLVIILSDKNLVLL